jgi:protein-S-isoprenylcysteine O-methyltransferase Ste14
MKRYLLIKPTTRMLIEWPIIIVVGLLGELLAWPRIPMFPYSNFIGVAIFAGGWIFHQCCHKAHKQAHAQSNDIEGLVTAGVFGRIRHPMYLSLILMYLGLAISWGVAWMLFPAVFFSAVTVLIAIQEEEFLLQKFGPQYEEYQRRVPWRLLPGIF